VLLEEDDAFQSIPLGLLALGLEQLIRPSVPLSQHDELMGT